MTAGFRLADGVVVVVDAHEGVRIQNNSFAQTYVVDRW